MNDAFGHPQSVVVLGGTSDIALELVAQLGVERGRSVVLAGRDRAALERAADDLRHQVARVETVPFDAATLDDVEKNVVRSFEVAAEAVDMVIVAVGELGSQSADEIDPDRIARMLTVNFTWPAAALSAVAGQLRQQGHGRIVVLPQSPASGSAAPTSSTAPPRPGSTALPWDCLKLFVARVCPCTSSVRDSCVPK